MAYKFFGVVILGNRIGKFVHVISAIVLVK
jgi:hypothetical protein